MSRLLATLRLDVNLQAKNNLYGIGIVVALLLGLSGRFFVPSDALWWVLPIFYLLAIGGTTFMFGASMVLLEKSERTLEALRVTPITVDDYVLSKAITLSAFAALESVIVYAIAAWGTPVNPALLLLGILAMGALNLFVGAALVGRHSSVTRFLFPDAVLASLVLQLPLFGVLEVGPDWLYYLFPSQPSLLLLIGAFSPLAPWQWAYAVVGSVVTVALAAVAARRSFVTHLGLRES